MSPRHWLTALLGAGACWLVLGRREDRPEGRRRGESRSAWVRRVVREETEGAMWI